MAAGRKKCPDCGKRGSWPKTLVLNTCETCTSTRLHHDTIRAGYIERCSKYPNTCHPSNPPMCPSCAEYFGGDTHKFFVEHSG